MTSRRGSFMAGVGSPRPDGFVVVGTLLVLKEVLHAPRQFTVFEDCLVRKGLLVRFHVRPRSASWQICRFLVTCLLGCMRSVGEGREV